MNDYCHLCDFDPCICGQHGNVDPVPHKKIDRSGPREIDEAMRDFVLTSHEAGERHNWRGWLELLDERFTFDRSSVREVWNRVSNGLQRDWLLIGDPDEDRDGPLMPPSAYPQVRRLTLGEATAEIEQLIAGGDWTADDTGQRLWQIWRRVPNALYLSIYEALHDMKNRGYLVTTTSPRGKASQFWYVKPDAVDQLSG